MAVTQIDAKLHADYVYKENTGSGVIAPGEILEYDSSLNVQRHSTSEGTVVPLLVATANIHQGDDVTTNWADGDNVRYVAPRNGDEVYVRVADGENISKGDHVESASNGVVQKFNADSPSSGSELASHRVIGVAKTAVNLTDSSGAETRQDQLLLVEVR